MTNEEKKKIYAALAAPFPEEAIERSYGKQTGRGYDTTGVKVQYIIDRLTNVLGLGGWRIHREVTIREINTSSGRRAFEAVCDLILELGEWIDGKFQVFAESLAYGGHVATSEGDSRKGAQSAALKRAAAMHGCGAAAYRGELDDDTSPAQTVLEQGEEGVTVTTLPTPRLQPCAPPTPTQQPNPAPPTAAAAPQRNRLSSKQLAAIWAIGRKVGYEQSQLRTWIKNAFRVQPEFLSRQAASEVIGALSKKAANGHASPESEHAREPGQEG